MRTPVIDCGTRSYRSTMGVSFTMGQDTDETIDLNFKDVTGKCHVLFPGSVRLQTMERYPAAQHRARYWSNL